MNRLFYFGGLLIPIIYLIRTRFRGKYFKPMTCGCLFQIFGYLMVYALLNYSRKSGASEWYYLVVLFYPVNFISIFYYLTIPLWFKKTK